MKSFEPKPENDFMEFIERYYKECRSQSEGIEAIAGKWTFEDIIPGLSDFDTRFICSNDMDVDDWCKMSTAVGKVHLDFCRRFPKWVRLLEHLPGMNLTWNEIRDEYTYYPEYKQWTFYYTSNPALLDRTRKILKKRPWDKKDEYFHLKKFATYYGPYDRNRDPGVNLGRLRNKYLMHSRIMHYFCPPVQSAMSIILKRNIAGKKEAFRLASNVFSKSTIFGQAIDIVNKHYEIPELYIEPVLSEFEDKLFSMIKTIGERLKDEITLIPKNEKENIYEWKQYIEQILISPQLKIFDNSKFSRLMKGRLEFYAKAPGYFENIWLIRNELGRLGEMFYRIPYRTFCKVILNEEIKNPDNIVKQLVPDILTQKEAEATLEFSRLLPGTWEKGTEVETALKVVEVFDDFFKGLNKINDYVREHKTQ